MTQPAGKIATYDDLYRLPENMTGEIIEGELHAFPRPHSKHAKATMMLGSRVTISHGWGEGGPGGWIILIEPEVMLGDNLLVPDLAGWKQERLPTPPKENWISIPPDWVCEILSPGTFRHDRVRKMPIYAQYGVGYLWLVDPLARLLEVFKLENNRWMVLGNYAEDDKVRAEPFQEIEIELEKLWWGD